MKRGCSGLSLVVGVDKPCGMTSHDVVGRVRRVFNERRVGHAGTLDPEASGVLLVCVGSATRLNQYLTGHDKRYEFDVAFGAATDTDDAEGAVIATAPVPDKVLDQAFACACAENLVGKTLQRPPLYSALKKDGKKACDVARAGGHLEIEPRPIEIYEADLVCIIPADEEVPYPRWRLRVFASKGTYVRSIARDLGESLGSAAHVTRLRRLQSGHASLDDCCSLEHLEQKGTRALLDPVMLLGYDAPGVTDRVLKAVQNGNAFPDAFFAHNGEEDGSASRNAPVEGSYICIAQEDALFALYQYSKGMWRAACVFNPPVSRKAQA